MGVAMKSAGFALLSLSCCQHGGDQIAWAGVDQGKQTS